MKKLIVLSIALTFLIAFSGCTNTSASKDTATAGLKNILLPVKEKGKWGYINTQGKMIIKPQFTEADSFSEGLGAVWQLAATDTQSSSSQSSGIAPSGTRCGYIDEKGNMVIQPKFTRGNRFSEGMAAFLLDFESGKWGYTDNKGNVVIPAKWGYAGRFKNGVAVVREINVNVGKGGLIDKTGKFIIEFDDVGDLYKSGYTGPVPFKKGSKWGYMDQKGKVIIQPKFDYAESFRDGAALVGFGEGFDIVNIDNVVSRDKKGKFAYINEKGAYVIPPAAFEGATGFTDGLAPVLKGGKWGYINKKGVSVIPHKFDAAWSFSGNTALVAVKIKGLGYINKSGAFVIPTKFGDAATSVSSGYTPVRDLYSDWWGYADTKGNLKIPYKYNGAGSFNGNMAVVRIESYFGLIDKSDKFVVEPKYIDIEYLDSEIYKLRMGDEVGYMDKNGKWIWKLE